MASIGAYLKSKFIKPVSKCVFIGLDNSGKTTLLYHLKVGSVLTTVPTIGFNVESLERNGKVLNVWELAGGDRIRPLLHHHYGDINSLLFMINCNDQERLDEAIEMLVDQTSKAICKGSINFLGIFLGYQDLLEPTSSLVHDIERKVTDAIVYKAKPQFPWTIYTQPGLSASTGSHINDVLENLIDNTENGKSLAWKGRDEELWTTVSYTEKLRVPCTNGGPIPLLERHFIEKMKANLLNDIDSGPPACGDNFLDLAREKKISEWDHRAQLRAMFLLLVPNLSSQTGNETPMSAVLLTVAQYLTFLSELGHVDKDDKYQIVISRTTATFYVYQIYLAFINLLQMDESLKVLRTIKMANFRRLLHYSPQLGSSYLWATYYSTTKFTSGLAYRDWVLPDLTTLPQIPSPSSTDESLVNRIKADSLSSSELADDISNAMLRRWAFSVLKKVKSTGERRGKLLPKALEALKRDIMSARIADSSLNAYSETQAYFWIQITHSTIDKLEKEEKDFDTTEMSYSTFSLLYPDALGCGRIWPEYYSEELWKSVKARMMFYPPDTGKTAPNVSIEMLDTGIFDWRPILKVKVPNLRELEETKEGIFKELKDSISDNSGFIDIQSEGVQVLNENLDDDDNTGAKTPTNDVDEQEWEMLGLPPSTPSELQVADSTPQNVDFSNIEKVLEKKLSMKPSPGTASIKQEEFKFVPEQRVWPVPSSVSHAKLLHSLFEHARRKTSPELDKTLSKIPINTRVFWTRRVADAFYESSIFERSRQSSDLEMDEGDQPAHDFPTFLTTHPAISWDGLWRLYYTELTWYSKDAEERVLKRDRLEVNTMFKELEKFKILWTDPL